MSERPSEALIVSDRGIVHYADRGSTFHQHCRTAGVLALTTTSLGMFTPLLCAALGFVVLGPLGGVIAASAATAAAVSIVNISALLGNERLERRLRARLAPAADDLEFVGLCRSENNSLRGKYLTPRLDTDDNVGFVKAADDALRILTEEGVVAIPRDEIRQITRCRCIELPYLSWIRIEIEDASATAGSFLLMSRQAGTIREVRARTDALYAKLVDWHTEGLLAWLENERQSTVPMST